MQTKILATVLALAALGAAGAAGAQPRPYPYPYPPGGAVRAVPPPPPLRAGHAWVPGRWEWRHGRQAWADGHWVRARPAPFARDPRRGGWDRDRDGVPDRFDRRPADPYRR